MQRPPLTYADRAALRHALAAESRSHAPQKPRSGVTTVWAPLAQKLSALLRRGAGLATRKSPARG